ncbi:hypothetical protein [Peterkaempfera sp. SMS 1(5)a]|uniref:hypothetical protein n=1 Tax=Peterkaempfera podocarpi TaxID=3232308 RepID=UPI00366A752E
MTESERSGTVYVEPIRYRMTLMQRLWPVFPAYVMAGVATPVLGLYTGLMQTAAGIVLGLLVLATMSHRHGIALTPSAAIVYGWGRRSIPWSRIQGVQVESALGERAVVLYEEGGRRTRLRAPSSTPFVGRDSAFEEKFHTIGEWWLAHRGPDWAPARPPGWWVGPAPSSGHPATPPAG